MKTSDDAPRGQENGVDEVCSGIDRGPGPAIQAPWQVVGSPWRIVAKAEPDAIPGVLYVQQLQPQPSPRDVAHIVHCVNDYDAVCDRAEAAEAEVARLLADVEVARADYFAVGGMPSMIDRSRDPEWFRRRTVKLLQTRADRLKRALADIADAKDKREMLRICGEALR